MVATSINSLVCTSHDGLASSMGSNHVCNIEGVHVHTTINDSTDCRSRNSGSAIGYDSEISKRIRSRNSRRVATTQGADLVAQCVKRSAGSIPCHNRVLDILSLDSIGTSHFILTSFNGSCRNMDSIGVNLVANHGSVYSEVGVIGERNIVLEPLISNSRKNIVIVRLNGRNRTVHCNRSTWTNHEIKLSGINNEFRSHKELECHRIIFSREGIRVGIDRIKIEGNDLVFVLGIQFCQIQTDGVSDLFQICSGVSRITQVIFGVPSDFCGAEILRIQMSTEHDRRVGFQSLITIRIIMSTFQDRREEVAYVHHDGINLTTTTDGIIIHGVIIEIELTSIERILTSSLGQLVQRQKLGHVGSPAHTVLRPTDFMTDDARGIQVNLGHKTKQVSCGEILVTAEVGVSGHDVGIDTGIELKSIDTFHNPVVANIVTEENIIQTFFGECIQGGTRCCSLAAAIHERIIVVTNRFLMSGGYKIVQRVLIKNLAAAALVTADIHFRILGTVVCEIIVDTTQTFANADD